MAACLLTDVDGYVYVDDTQNLCDYMALTPAEYDAYQASSIQGLQELLESLFTFNPEVFQDYFVFCLITFIGSLSAGVIWRYLTR